MFPSPGNSPPSPRRAADALGRERPRPVPQPVRHQHRERDFGIGYGNSSGYASNRRYAAAEAGSYFRCR